MRFLDDIPSEAIELLKAGHPLVYRLPGLSEVTTWLQLGPLTLRDGLNVVSEDCFRETSNLSVQAGFICHQGPFLPIQILQKQAVWHLPPMEATELTS